jgi:type II secretory pathway component PulF
MNLNVKIQSKKVSGKEKALFTRSLATTIEAGLPLVKALEILSNQTSNQYFKGVIIQMIQLIEQGDKFSSALAKHPKIFDAVYIYSIAAAEESGKFEQILLELADKEENDYKLESSVRGALAYPLFIIAAMVVVGALLIVMVIPKIEQIFVDSKLTLPITTRMLIWTAKAIQGYWYIMIAVVAGAIAWIKYYFNTQPGRKFYSHMVITIPVVRDVFVNVYMARFSKTLGMLSNAGLPIIKSVELVSKVINNTIYEEILVNTVTQIERGIPMSYPLSQSKAFPAIVSQMIAVGEQTGRLDEVMTSLSKFFEQESSRNVNMITSLLEPILLIIVGIGVGVLVFSIIVPLYQATSSVS